MDHSDNGNSNFYSLLYMNKLIEIQQFSMEQMEKWGLIEKNWTFVWDNKAVRRYGQCRYRQREIGITKKLVLINTIEESKDVVLHEIAHALTGAGHGHDAVWKRMCVKVGARPERCYKPKDRGGNVNTIEAKYLVVHKDTGEVYNRYHRRPKIKDWSDRWIRGKKAHTYGKLQLIANKANNTYSPYKIKI